MPPTFEMNPNNPNTSRAVAADATIGEGTTIGEYCVIEPGVRIGRDCAIGHHVVIHAGTIIGDDVRVDASSVIGKQPMRSRNSATTSGAAVPAATIGNGTMVGANAVVYAGCTIGENVLIADLATIREAVSVGDFTIVGRGVAIENKCTVGRYCKLETNVYLAAYSTIEDRVFLAPGVLTSNDNFIGRTEERFKHFKGATVRRGGRVGVQTRNADEDTIYAGVPARKFGAVPAEQKLDNQGWKDE